MRIKIQIGLFSIMLILMTTNAHAEYFSVYPAPEEICLYGCKKVYKERVSVSQNEYGYVKKVQRAKYSDRKHKNSCEVDVYYVQPAIPYEYCPECEYSQRRSNYEVTYDEPATFNYVHVKENFYDPDLSTGDDDASVHPDMQMSS